MTWALPGTKELICSGLPVFDLACSVPFPPQPSSKKSLSIRKFPEEAECESPVRAEAGNKGLRVSRSSKLCIHHVESGHQSPEPVATLSEAVPDYMPCRPHRSLRTEVCPSDTSQVESHTKWKQSSILSIGGGRRTFKATDISLERNSKARGYRGSSVVNSTR